MGYLTSALQMLPAWSGVAYRAILGRVEATELYLEGRPVQWGTICSLTTDLVALKSVVSPASCIIAKVDVRAGKDISPYAFLPNSGEVLLPAEARFVVTVSAYDRLGFTFVDLVQESSPPSAASPLPLRVPDEAVAAAIFEQWDSDGNGLLSLEEFKNGVRKATSPLRVGVASPLQAGTRLIDDGHEH